MTKPANGRRRRTVILKPRLKEPTMVKEQGMWVKETVNSITVEDVNAVIEAVREERHRQIVGPSLK